VTTDKVDQRAEEPLGDEVAQGTMEQTIEDFCRLELIER